MPDYSKNEIIDILKERRTLFKDNSIEDFFLGMFNNKLSVALLKVGKWVLSTESAMIFLKRN